MILILKTWRSARRSLLVRCPDKSWHCELFCVSTKISNPNRPFLSRLTFPPFSLTVSSACCSLVSVARCIFNRADGEREHCWVYFDKSPQQAEEFHFNNRIFRGKLNFTKCQLIRARAQVDWKYLHCLPAPHVNHFKALYSGECCAIDFGARSRKVLKTKICKASSRVVIDGAVSGVSGPSPWNVH